MVYQKGGKFERFQKLHFIQIDFFSQMFIGWYMESDEEIRKIWRYGHFKKIFEFLFTNRLLSCGILENNFTGISEISFQDKSLSVNKMTK